MLDTHPAGVYLVLAIAAVTAALLVFLVGKWALGRPRVNWWFMGVTVAALVTVLGTTPAVAQYFFPDPADRFHRELAGPGQCLGTSPYATKDGHPVSSWMNYADPALPKGRMVVQPLDKGAPALALDHAVRGGTHSLTPADEQSAAILRSYGC
ncbi:hypothetical protein ACFC26_17220 [Kitasatospora purpeofusca]|uniref:hypothetical protein n=1 Tax=Kitasatospora purpeofusca TaxID=67352 RepID=UPI0035DB6111